VLYARLVMAFLAGCFPGIILFLISQNPLSSLLAFAGGFALIMGIMVTFDRTTALRVELGEHALRIRGDLFGKEVPYSRMLLDDATIENLSQPGPLRPKWKLLGTAMPGYYAGTFSLRNRSRGLVFISSMEAVAAIPLDKNGYLLLGVREPAAFLDALRLAAARNRDEG